MKRVLMLVCLILSWPAWSQAQVSIKGGKDPTLSVTTLTVTGATALQGSVTITGTVIINNTIAANDVITVTVSDAATTTVTDVLKLIHNTSDTPAAGLGTGLQFQVEDLGGDEEQGRIDVAMRTVTDGAEDANMIFKVNAGGTMREGMRVIGLTGEARVGINNVDPVQTLAVKSPGVSKNVISVIQDSTTSGIVQLGETSGAAGLMDLLGADHVVDVRIQADGDSYFNGGDVGIGTASPASALDVVGDITLDDATNADINFQNSDNLKWTLRANSSQEEFSIVDQDATGGTGTRLLIDNAGNVGIGTIAPQAFLDINPTTADTLFAVWGDFQGKLADADSIGIVVLPDGKVGIGTASPGALLDVFKTGTNNPIAFFGSTGGTDNQSVAFRNGVGDLRIFNSGGNDGFMTGTTAGDVGIKVTAGDDLFVGQATAHLVIKDGGNVGLGTILPGTNLEIDEASSGNAAHPILTMVNSDTASTGETGQTTDVIFEFAGSSNSGTSWTNQEAGKISSYKIADYWGADETDFDAGVKLYTVTDGSYVLSATFSNDDVTLADDLTIDGTYNFAADSQGDDDYEVAIPGITALTTGLMVTFTANTLNTDGATLEITSVGDLDALLKGDGVALATGDITAGLPITALFNGTNWIIMSRLASD